MAGLMFSSVKLSGFPAISRISWISMSWDSMKPRPCDAFPCGSMSKRRVFFSRAAKLAAKFTAVVVLPTPPFWLHMAIILLIITSSD